MFCVRCRRLFWRDPKPVGRFVKPKQNTRCPQGGGKDPKQCPGDAHRDMDERSEMTRPHGGSRVSANH